MILASVASVLALTSVSLARTWYIAPDGTGDAPTIQAGIDSASAADEVVLADGIYTGAGNRDVYTNGIAVRSESGNRDACVIDCQGTEAQPHRAFYLTAPGAILEGVKAINGYVTDEGGAIEARGDVSIINCVFENNYAPEGGAVVVYDFYLDGVTTISECEFLENEAFWTGAALSVGYRFTEIALDHCTFISNSSTWPYGHVIDLTEWSEEEIAVFQMTNCSVAGNDGGISAGIGLTTVIERTIIAYNGRSTDWAELSCCNLFGNEAGDWVGDIADQYGIRGNISACPSFCHLGLGDVGICDESPCAPGNHPDGYDCGLIGARGVGCACGPTGTESSTWGAIKSIYR